MAKPSSILAWKIPWTEEPGGPWGRRESDTTEHTHTPWLNRLPRWEPDYFLLVWASGCVRTVWLRSPEGNQSPAALTTIPGSSSSYPERGTQSELNLQGGLSRLLLPRLAHNSSDGLCSLGPKATHTHTHTQPCTWNSPPKPHCYQESHCQMHTLKMLKGWVFLLQGPIPNHKRPLSLSGAWWCWLMIACFSRVGAVQLPPASAPAWHLSQPGSLLGSRGLCSTPTSAGPTPPCPSPHPAAPLP